MLKFRLLTYFKSLLFPLSLLGFAIVAGTIGYMVIEGFSFLDAIYMTVITIASVGYGETHPLSTNGRIFTIWLILFNLLSFTLFIAAVSRTFLDGELMREYKLLKMQTHIDKLEKHVIVCGFGRNGKEAAHVLSQKSTPFVVIEHKATKYNELDFQVAYHIEGDAIHDEVLVQAGIQRASALITTLPNDSDNLYVVLTARQLNPSLKIISRASQDSSVNKLKTAGATNVIMPDKIGGAHMASLVMIPDVMEMISLLTTSNGDAFLIEEMQSSKGSILGEIRLWERTGCNVLAVKHERDYLLNPPADYYVSPGERLILMGSRVQLQSARELL